ncbi:MAG: hypothetical protein JOZ45_21250 [Acidobacteriaceae bacterium]|nr:hypothetical protein [Acidobacteriaceae bacterium]
MFEALLFVALAITTVGILIAYDGSRDVFHPLFFIGPMLAFLYGWMPLQLLRSGSLFQYFDLDQLESVQGLNVLGILAFVLACLAAGCRVRQSRSSAPKLSSAGCRRLRIGALMVGGVGLACWLISIINVGGFVNAFSKSYAGGWDDSGYVRDGNLLLLVGVLLALGAMGSEGLRFPNLAIAALFGLPWLTQALLTARRGPTFAISILVLMGSYLIRNKRPPVLSMIAVGAFLGWLSLFLVTNRGNIYLGSQAALTTDMKNIRSIVEKSDTGNEYIYGTGSVVSTERRGHYFWMRRYLAQLLVRPIPSSIWPTKYEDFGVPELLSNAGTGEGFADALGWVGAVGSAPGIIADLWIEVWWLAVPFMAVLGWAYGYIWRKAVTGGPAWKCQYVIVAALSMYLVMQTMEAVIFRTLLLSAPSWLIWKWSLKAKDQTAEGTLYVVEPDLLKEGALYRA